MNRAFQIVATSLCVLLMLAARNANAAIVTYSWSGTIAPNTSDQWGLGDEKRFEVSISVDSEATDYYDSVVNWAEFDVFNLVVKIDGVEATTIDHGRITFQDNRSSGAFDGIELINARVTLNGETLYFRTLVLMSDATAFSFTSEKASPPVFSPRASADGTGTYISGYHLRPDSMVASVLTEVEPEPAATPEPASLAIWGLGALGCTVFGYRRRKQIAA